MYAIFWILLPESLTKEAVLGAVAGAGFSAAIALTWFEIWRQRQRAPARRLLGRLGADKAAVGIYVRQMFVPGNEFFSRDPENQGMPGSVAVRKWTNIPEVFDSAEIKAASELIHLLGEVGSGAVTLKSVEKESGRWTDDAVSIGGNFKSFQILDTCEPKLVAFRNPDAFRSLVTRDVFETKGSTDFGLIYKGQHPSNHRTFLVLMGIGPAGTVAAALYLRSRLSQLGNLTGGAPFAAIVAADSAAATQGAGALRWLYPKPSWWRRLLWRKDWRKIWGSAGPPTS